MKLLRIILPIFCLITIAASCSDEDPTLIQDFRDEYIGIYDCEKGSTIIELEVKKDSDNENNVLIGPYSIPVDENGNYGPEVLDGSTVVHLEMDGENILFSEHKPIINGIVIPCVLEGKKRS